MNDSKDLSEPRVKESVVLMAVGLAKMALEGASSEGQAELFDGAYRGGGLVPETTIRTVAVGKELDLARELIREYGDSLGVDLSFQGFEEELAGLPGDYSPPAGALMLAFVGNFTGHEAAGCVALRSLGDGVCEMKRLYVRPRWRGLGIGGQLIEAVLGEARRAGYRAIRLDTLPSMTAARATYEALGFRAIAPYYESPIPGTAFLELDLSRPSRKSA